MTSAGLRFALAAAEIGQTEPEPVAAEIGQAMPEPAETEVELASVESLSNAIAPEPLVTERLQSISPEVELGVEQPSVTEATPIEEPSAAPVSGS